MKRLPPRTDRGRIWKCMYIIMTSKYCNPIDLQHMAYWQLGPAYQVSSYEVAEVPQDVVPDFDNFCLVYKRFKNRK